MQLGDKLAALPVRRTAVSVNATSYSNLDTCSEPPRCSGLLSEKLRSREGRKFLPNSNVAVTASRASTSSKAVVPSSSSTKSKGIVSRSRSSENSARGSAGSPRMSVKSSSTRKPSKESSKSVTSSRSRKNHSDSSRSRKSGSKSSSRPYVDPPSHEGSQTASLSPSSSLASSLNGEEEGVIVPYDPPSKDTRQPVHSECSEELDKESPTVGTSITGSFANSVSSGSEKGPTEELGSVEEEVGGELVVVNRDDNHDQYEGAIVPKDEFPSQSLVPRSENLGYLASAVDNELAVLPNNTGYLYEAYEHTYVTCPEDMRFRFLYTFLKKNSGSKIIIFFSTTNSAKFYARLLDHIHIPVMTMHGKQRKERFIETFFQFSDQDTGVLCVTDAAGRELDIPPSVDWVIQFEPPDDPSEYISRVARISCDDDRIGRSLLFLNPAEQGFLRYYRAADIHVSEFELPRCCHKIQDSIERIVMSSESLQAVAREAYGSYLIAYASHGFRDVYNVHDLEKRDVALTFGLTSLPPVVNDNDSLYAEEDISQAYGGESYSRHPSNASRQSSKQSIASKNRNKSWMKGEKSWPHCKVRMHSNYVSHREEHYDASVGSQHS